MKQVAMDAPHASRATNTRSRSSCAQSMKISTVMVSGCKAGVVGCGQVCPRICVCASEHASMCPRSRMCVCMRAYVCVRARVRAHAPVYVCTRYHAHVFECM